MPPHPHPPSRWKYVATGVLLGIGAPLGALVLRMLSSEAVRRAPAEDVAAHAFFYLYSLAGSCLVFAVAGYVAGKRAERLYAAEEFYHRLADHDSLTGLYNGRVFRERYQRAVERAARTGQSVGVMVIDVDKLKDINDRHGHDVGSAALEHVARALRVGKRASDDAARWGGDEFAILLDSADAAAATRVAERIVQWLHDHPLRPGLNVTVTIGVAAQVPRSPDDDLFAIADVALYEGKRAGRDRVRIGKPE